MYTTHLKLSCSSFSLSASPSGSLSSLFTFLPSPLPASLLQPLLLLAAALVLALESVQLFSLLLSTFLCSSGNDVLSDVVGEASKPLEEGVAVGSCDIEGVLILCVVESCSVSLFSCWPMSLSRPGEFSSRSLSEPVDVFRMYLPDLHVHHNMYARKKQN